MNIVKNKQFVFLLITAFGVLSFFLPYAKLDNNLFSGLDFLFLFFWPAHTPPGFILVDSYLLGLILSIMFLITNCKYKRLLSFATFFMFCGVLSIFALKIAQYGFWGTTQISFEFGFIFVILTFLSTISFQRLAK